MYSPKRLTISQLRARVVAATRHRILNGEFTERGLARLAGISQPHLHNVMKGVRELTSDVGDSLLVAMDIGLLDLVEQDELAQAVESLRASTSISRMIPVLGGRIGPGSPIPDPRQPISWRPLPSGLSIVARRPAITLLAPDPDLAAMFPRARAAVIDTDEMARLRPEPLGLYVLKHPTGGLIRQVRLQAGQLEILGQTSFACQSFQRDLWLGSTSVLQVIRARVCWVGASLEWPLTEAGELPDF